jgi:hypothetical protein
MSVLRYSLKIYRSAIAIAAICLISTVAVMPADIAFAQNRRTRYGLGSLPESARSGAGTRIPNELPKIVFLGPDDGSLTLSERPTFYWYVASVSSNTANPRFTQDFVLRRDPHKKNSKGVDLARTILRASANSTKTGLYRLTLPPTVPGLEPAIDRGWQIQLPPDLIGMNDVVVRMENKPAAIAELSKAKTNLEKARIYERYGYWYDAFDAYTKWLEVNPKDTAARRERANMIEIGLKDNRDFRDEGKPNLKLLSELQSKIDASVATDLEPHTVEIKP